MNATTVAVDLAKEVIELAVADGVGRVVARRRVGRKAFSVFSATHPKGRIVMEACGGAHPWARVAQAASHDVRLLPAQYVRPYRRRNKTDRADCLALLEALRNPRDSGGASEARGGPSHSRAAPHSFAVAGDAHRADQRTAWAVAGIRSGASLHDLLGEIRALDARIIAVERQLGARTREVPSVERLRQISGIGLLPATALYASAGDAKHFKSGRHLAAWIGLTPKSIPAVTPADSDASPNGVMSTCARCSHTARVRCWPAASADAQGRADLEPAASLGTGIGKPRRS